MIKPSSLTRVLAALGLLVCASAVTLQAGTDYVAEYGPVLKGTPALELPAKSASLVSLAKPAEKQSVALAVVKVVSKLNPSALPTVVGAIARVDPSLAPVLTTEATKLQPQLSGDLKLATLTVSQNNNDKPNPVPDPEPTSRGKKKGHYKGTPEGPPGQNP